MTQDPQAFIRAHTRLQSPPLTPEIRLFLADEITPLWQMIEAERGVSGVPPPYWAFAWIGGQAIARYLLDHPEGVSGRQVLDFGSGSGLCALAASRAGAASVGAADIDTLSRAAVALNAAANGLQIACAAEDVLAAAPPPVDLILAGDVFYEEVLARRVLSWLRLANARGTRVLLGDPGRTYFPREGLVRLAAYQVVTTRDLEASAVREVGVYTFPDRAAGL